MKKAIYQLILTALLSSCVALSVAAQQENKRAEVKIYLLKTLIDPSGATSDELTAVKRKVNADSSLLRSTLELLFAPNITAKEKKRNFSSSTYGMKFEGLDFKDGIATVKFSQPTNETNYGSSGAAIFAQAVEKTAKQFSDVRRLRLCAIGDTLIDAQLETQFPRCRD